MDFDTFFQKFTDHLEDKKVTQSQGQNVEYESKIEDVSCFFCPYSDTQNVEKLFT